MVRIYFRYVFTVGCLFLWQAITAQIITTFAGNGTQGYSGDGGQATVAQLKQVRQIAFDNYGNLYIADAGNNVVRKVTTSGIITTVAGKGTAGYSGDGGLATNAELNIPEGVYADSSGNLFIADQWNHVIRKVNTIGIISTFAGTGSTGYSGDGGPASTARFYYPTGVIGDGHGNLFILDDLNHVVRKIDPSGIVSTVAGNGLGSGTTTGGYSGDGGPATAAALNRPRGVCFDGTGNMYIADAKNNVVRKVTQLGIISTVVGNGVAGYSGDNGPATNAKMDDPQYTVLDQFGNLYVAEGWNSVVRKINTLGIITTIAGNGTMGYSGDGGVATNARLSGPTAIVFDKYYNLYISDWSNSAIRRVSNEKVETPEPKKLNDLLLYPNPTKDVLVIKSADEIKNISIINLLGQIVYDKRCNNKYVEIDISELPDCTYFVKVNNVTTRKFVKE